MIRNNYTRARVPECEVIHYHLSLNRSNFLLFLNSTFIFIYKLQYIRVRQPELKLSACKIKLYNACCFKCVRTTHSCRNFLKSIALSKSKQILIKPLLLWIGTFQYFKTFKTIIPCCLNLFLKVVKSKYTKFITHYCQIFSTW